MFTGIITHLGKVRKNENNALIVSAPKSLLKELKPSASVAVNGICLTVVKKSATGFSIQYMPETAAKTTIASWQKGDLLNLELAAKLSDRLEGHIVQGHVDGRAKLTAIKPQGNSYLLRFKIPPSSSRYLIPKGSAAINGVSLTVIDTGKDWFTVGIIPYTWEHTNFHALKVGNEVNVEYDVLAKYVERLIKR